MKSYRIKTFNRIDGIVEQGEPVPVPKNDEVLVKIMAVSLNKRDISILNKTYPLPPNSGIIPLSDGAGEVIATGNTVTKFRAGDRVSGAYFPKWRSGRFGTDVMDQLGCTLDGMLAEYVCLKEDYLIRIPDYLSWEEASTLPCAGLTAWASLKDISPAHTILTMGTGGVSIFALQFAKMRGAKVIALTSRNKKVQALYDMGADKVIDTKENTNWDLSVMEATNQRGVDRVIETGGSETLLRSVKSGSIGGEIILLNPAAEHSVEINLNQLTYSMFVRLLSIRTQFVGSRHDFEDMNEALTTNQLRPIITKTFSFNEIHQAYEFFSKGEHLGKVVIRVGI